MSETGKITHQDTKLSTFQPKNDMLLWLDVAIQIRKLSPSEIAKVCSEVYATKKEESWRQAWYDWVRLEGFKEWFYLQYMAHFKNELGAKGYARLHDRMDNEKDMSKIIQVLEHVEGKKDGGIAIQVNNVIAAKKEEYKI